MGSPNDVAPISRLLPELLREVFTYLRLSDNKEKDHFRRPYTVRHKQLATLALISRLWNEVASPLLWRTLRFGSETGQQDCIRMLSGEGGPTRHEYGMWVRN